VKKRETKIEETAKKFLLTMDKMIGFLSNTLTTLLQQTLIIDYNHHQYLFLTYFLCSFLFLSKLNIFHHFLLPPVPPWLLSIITHCGKSRLFDQKINFAQ